jgi:PAS domain S-box-containing protein
LPEPDALQTDAPTHRHRPASLDRFNAPLAWLAWIYALVVSAIFPYALDFDPRATDLWWSAVDIAAVAIGAGQWLAIARADRHGERYAAALIGLGLLAWGGSAAASLLGTALGSTIAEFPSATGLGFGLFAPLMGCGLALYIRRTAGERELVPLLTDLGVMAATLIPLVGFPLNDFCDQAGFDLAERAGAIAYPVVCGMLGAFSLYCLVVFGWGARRWILLLLVAGAGLVLAADFLFAFDRFDDNISFGRILDPVWPLGLALISLAAFEHNHIRESRRAPANDAVAARFQRIRQFVPPIGMMFVIYAVIDDASLGDLGLNEAAGLLVPSALLFGGSLALSALWNRGQIARLEHRVGAADAALRQSEARFGAMLAYSPDPTLVIDRDCRIRAVGRGVESVFGIGAAAAVGQPIAILSAEIAASVTQQALAGLAEMHGMQMLASHRFQARAQRSSGESFPVDGLVYPLEHGDESLFAVVLRDVTERVEAEDRLRAAKETAELANRSKSEFLTNMSHELRTPLNAIIGFAEIIERQSLGPGDPRYAGYARDIRQSGESLLAILKDILDFSRIDSRGGALRESDVDLGQLIDSCCRMIHSRATDRDLTLSVALPDPPVHIYGDPVKLKQVVLNLLSNAVKFTPRGGRIEVGAALQPQGAATITISDTGIGMRAEDIPTALAPFGLIGNPLSRGQAGIGLGLPLAQRLVKLHQGRLEIACAPKAGVTVTVHLPRERVHAPVPARAAATG